jgi:hypothetical protein
MNTQLIHFYLFTHALFPSKEYKDEETYQNELLPVDLVFSCV